MSSNTGNEDINRTEVAKQPPVSVANCYNVNNPPLLCTQLPRKPWSTMALSSSGLPPLILWGSENEWVVEGGGVWGWWSVGVREWWSVGG